MRSKSSSAPRLERERFRNASSQAIRGSRDTVVAITLGDPAGVGPEVALRATLTLLTASPSRRSTVGGVPGGSTRIVLVGDLGVARDAARRLDIPVDLEPCAGSDLRSAIADGRAGRRARRVLPVVAPGRLSPSALTTEQRRPGKPTVAGARVAFESIRTAVELAQAGLVDAICTAPINKEWFDRAGVASTGHTEILAELTRAQHVRLMMAQGRLRVVLATTHLALRDVAAALSVEGLRDTIAITARHLTRWWGISRPRVAVAALNPHASDGGVYGDEEARILIPAIRRARAARIDVLGPVPADTLFSAVGPRCDAVVAMYHDQGLIPVKQLDVHHAVNVTLGLPFIRTSPDHGTAYDLAGTGRADPRSMLSALELAVRLARLERKRSGARTARAR